MRILENPKSYIDSNLRVFANILELSKSYSIEHLIFASSSSVYGDQKKFPVKESKKHFPKNIYATTKILNESIAEFYSRYFKGKIM